MKKIENSFVVTGFIGKDAEIRSFATVSVARFSVALSRPEKAEENPHYISAFIHVEAWRKNESKESFEVLKKGSLVTIEGYFKPEEWQDSETGQRRNRVILVVTKFYLAPEKAEESASVKQTPKRKRQSSK